MSLIISCETNLNAWDRTSLASLSGRIFQVQFLRLFKHFFLKGLHQFSFLENILFSFAFFDDVRQHEGAWG